jgi:hypothetical protein
MWWEPPARSPPVTPSRHAARPAARNAGATVTAALVSSVNEVAEDEEAVDLTVEILEGGRYI